MIDFRITRLSSYVLLVLCALALAVACAQARAQQMSPVIMEFDKKARGAVHVANTGDTPKIVSCHAQGFDPDEHGAPQSHPLDKALNVRIASERVMLPPQSSRQISFDATPAIVPAWFLVTCQFAPVERGKGMTVVMVISSIVIIHGGQLNPQDVALSARRVGAAVEVTVKNNGSELARVDSGAVIGHRKQADLGTFLLYPHQKRLVKADWKETTPPETVRIQIGKNRLEAVVN